MPVKQPMTPDHRPLTTDAGPTLVPPEGEPYKTVVIEFDPDGDHILYGDVAASDLVPALRCVLARLESGALRMPLTGGFRWVDDAAGA